MNRREMILRAAVAIGGGLLGSPAWRVLAGEVPTASPVQPLFTALQSEMVSVLAEMVIPETDTPGAIAAGTPAFIEMMVAQWYTETERGIFLAGLGELDTWCRGTVGGPFLQCNESERTQALGEAERQAGTYVSPFLGGPIAAAMAKFVDENTPFFIKLKELVVIGYYSSEIGATQEMVYNPMPMRYEGDFDYAKNGERQWSY